MLSCILSFFTPHNKYLSLTDPVNETVQGNLSYSPGVFSANYTYLTPHDKSIPYYRVFLLQAQLGATFFQSFLAGRMHYNTLPPVDSFNRTLKTTMKYYFVVRAINKYMKHDVQVVLFCFTINEENEIVYRNGYTNSKSCTS